MKILYVYGDNDYNALDFERRYGIGSFDNISTELYNKIINDKNDDSVYDTFEFNDIDKDFIDFVKYELMSYDQMKAENFYIIK